MTRLAFVLSVALPSLTAAASVDLAAGFCNPPASAKPHTWWHWMNGNVSQEGITADLEAMKEIGLGGAQIFDIDYGMPPGPVRFNTPEWRACVIHAAKECERLGLELVLNTASGWSAAGAPWNTITNGQKFVVTRETSVRGPQRFDGVLEPPRPEGWNGDKLEPDRSKGSFSADLAVLAYPTPKAGSATPVSGLWEKMYRVSTSGADKKLNELRGNPGGLVDAAQVVDLTSRVDKAGRLVWDVPAGDWTILRVGYMANGRQNYPASAGGQGLECDKLSRRALEAHWAGLMDQILPLCGKGVKGVVIDSYEAEVMNWTEGLAEIFEKRRGYSLKPFFPAFAGRIVGSTERTERFFEDFRRTISELFVENFGFVSKRKANAFGLQLNLEPYWHLPACDFEFSHAADIPMTEFWTFDGACRQWRNDPDSAVCEAHVWGKPIVAAESYTTWPKLGRWQLDPWVIKAQTDYEYCCGINRIAYHTYAHQPWTDERLVPGMTMGRFGIMFNRNVTWWKMGRPWIEYQTRCQYLLQQGHAVADVFYYYGEDPLLHKVFGYDELSDHTPREILSTEALFACTARDGWLIAPSGAKVRYLLIPKTVTTISPKVLRRIDEIAAAGVTVIGAQPRRPYGLTGFPESDVEFKALVQRIWSRKNVLDRTWFDANRRKVHPDYKVDFRPPEGDAGKGLFHIHRQTDDGTDIYFLARSKEDAARVECAFRVRGKKPELWCAETKEMCLPRDWREEGDYTFVTVPFNPRGSMFVMFPKAPTKGVKPEKSCETVSEQVIGGPWHVRFQKNRGAPAEATFDALVSWTDRPEEGIRYFSGTARYEKTFSRTPSKAGMRTILDLGEMQNLATVRLNGRTVGVVWRRPYEIDVTDFLRAGENKLVVDVVNKWPNRLIGDEQKPTDIKWIDDHGWPGRHPAEWPEWLSDPSKRTSGRLTFATWHHWNKDEKPLPSGLMGPVKLKTQEIK